jgi:hypothetical protein
MKDTTVKFCEERGLSATKVRQAHLAGSAPERSQGLALPQILRQYHKLLPLRAARVLSVLVKGVEFKRLG